MPKSQGITLRAYRIVDPPTWLQNNFCCSLTAEELAVSHSRSDYYVG